MEERIKPLKERVLARAVDVVYSQLIGKSGRTRPKRIYLYGAEQQDLTEAMIMLYSKLRFHSMEIYTEETEGACPVALIGGLEHLAFLCKEDFYSLPKENRQCSIVVNGGNYLSRRNFAALMVPIVDVFVSTQEQFPEPAGQYIIDLDDFPVRGAK